MQKIESTTTEILEKDSGSSDKQESGEIPSMDIQKLSTNLSQEKSSSVTLLNESAQLLTKSAKVLLMGEKGDFGDEVIRRPTFTEVDSALKLALGANEIIKTKLDHLRFAKRMIDDSYE